MSSPGMFHQPVLHIPEPEDEGQNPLIDPGHYTLPELVELLREHAEDPGVIRFIADMLEP